MHVKFKKSSQIGLAKFYHCFVCHALPSPITFCLLKYGWGEYGSLSCITMEVTNIHIVEPFAQPWVSEHGNLPCSPFLMGFSFFCTLSMGTTCKLHTSHPWEPHVNSTHPIHGNLTPHWGLTPLTILFLLGLISRLFVWAFF